MLSSEDGRFRSEEEDLSDCTSALYPQSWNWSMAPSSPSSSLASSPTTSSSSPTSSSPYQIASTPTSSGRRGRPKSETITALILNGSSSESSIKCSMCCRVFPRLKSLRAHIRTHTGERPYICDYPDCKRAFAQSGQLRTHQRLHTGEKPFICGFKGCESRFTHPNRRCPRHPSISLERHSTIDGDKYGADIENTNEEVLLWLEKHYKERSEKTITGSTTKQKLEPEPKKPRMCLKKKIISTKDVERHIQLTPEKDGKYSVALALLELSNTLYSPEDLPVTVITNATRIPPNCKKALILE